MRPWFSGERERRGSVVLGGYRPRRNSTGDLGGSGAGPEYPQDRSGCRQRPLHPGDRQRAIGGKSSDRQKHGPQRHRDAARSHKHAEGRHVAERKESNFAMTAKRLALVCAAATGLLAAAYGPAIAQQPGQLRSEEHTSELQSLMSNSYAVFCLKKTKTQKKQHKRHTKSKIQNSSRTS